MTKNVIDEDEQIEILNERLKDSEKKLNNVLNLVYKTFTGNSCAAEELSEIVGVTPPILCSEEKEKTVRIKKTTDIQEKSSYPETNSRLAIRMDFLDQVMVEHDRMMKPNYPKNAFRKMSSNINSSTGIRVQSADRASRGPDHSNFNPYTWTMNEHLEDNGDSLYKPELSNVSNFCQTKPLIPKSAKYRPQTKCSTFTEMKLEQLLQHSESRRSSRMSGHIVPDTRDYKLTYDTDDNDHKPPRPPRPTSSISHKRNPSARFKQKLNSGTAYHQLNLQPMEGLYDNCNEMLQSMEQRFQHSTIDLQRRLGIPEAGMVGP